MADLHTWTGEATEDEIVMMEDRMRLFIFPNDVGDDEEKVEAFDKAVAYQIAHEKSFAEVAGKVPNSVKEFKIGDFRMSFEDGVNEAALNRKNICPAAYSILLRAGLLYRGLEGRCGL